MAASSYSGRRARRSDPARLPHGRNRRPGRRRRRRRRLALHQQSQSGRRYAGAVAAIEVNVQPIAGRPGHHREVARQAGVHPPPHAGRDQGSRGRADVGAARSADRQFARHRHRQEGAAGVADHRSASAPISAACRSATSRAIRQGPVRRLVLPLPRLGTTTRRAASARARRRKNLVIPDYLFTSRHSRPHRLIAAPIAQELQQWPRLTARRRSSTTR